MFSFYNCFRERPISIRSGFMPNISDSTRQARGDECEASECELQFKQKPKVTVDNFFLQIKRFILMMLPWIKSSRKKKWKKSSTNLRNDSSILVVSFKWVLNISITNKKNLVCGWFKDFSKNCCILTNSHCHSACHSFSPLFELVCLTVGTKPWIRHSCNDKCISLWRLQFGKIK